MALLRKMSFDSLVCIGAVMGRFGVGETWKGVEVTRFDGIKPGLLDREADTGMIESHQCSHAREINAAWVKGPSRFCCFNCHRHFLVGTVHVGDVAGLAGFVHGLEVLVRNYRWRWRCGQRW